MIFWQIGGTLLAIAGVGALYLAWKKKERDWRFVLTGWSFVTLGIVLWAQTSGVDKGPALGIVVVTLIGLMAIAARALAGPTRVGRPNVIRLNKAGGGIEVGAPRYGAAANIAAIVVVGLAVSIAVCTALFMGNRVLGVEHTSNLTLTMFSFPMLWGILATYIGYSTSIIARITTLLGLTATSLLIILSAMGAA